MYSLPNRIYIEAVFVGILLSEMGGSASKRHASVCTRLGSQNRPFWTEQIL